MPGRLDAATVGALVEGIGERKVSVIWVPGSLPQRDLADLGVARISFGPWSQRIALTALADAGTALLAGGAPPSTVRAVS